MPGDVGKCRLQESDVQGQDRAGDAGEAGGQDHHQLRTCHVGQKRPDDKRGFDSQERVAGGGQRFGPAESETSMHDDGGPANQQGRKPM